MKKAIIMPWCYYVEQRTFSASIDKKSRVNRATDEGLESWDQTVICIKKLAGTWMNLIAAVESDVMTWIEIDFYSII